MTDLQSKLLEMLQWLHDFCQKNKLTYYIIGGTMLGAARHKGFIPWDDDIDIAMPRDDYEILLIKLNKPFEHYYVESPKDNNNDFPYGFAKFYDLNTTLVEDVRRKVVRGIYIDIFPLDGIGNTIEESKRNYRAIDATNMLLAMRVCKIKKDRKWWKNIGVIVGALLPISIKKLSIKLDRLCSKRNYNECLFVGNLMSTYRSREIMKKDIFGIPTLYEFEGIKVFGPEKYNEYLTILYHHWGTLPPEDKRKSAHDFTYISYEQPFKNYKK